MFGEEESRGGEEASEASMSEGKAKLAMKYAEQAAQCAPEEEEDEA